MYLIKRTSFILFFITTFVCTSFRTVDIQSSENKNEIEVYYSRNQGAYTLTMAFIQMKYDKKCVLKNDRKNEILLNEIEKVIEKEENKIVYSECCSYVIEYKKNGKSIVVGFDKSKGIIHCDNSSFKIDPSVLSNLKRRCIGKW
jgi:hypothetical protein